MKTLKVGDVVVIEWKDINPHTLTMKKYDGQEGKVISDLDCDYYVQMKDGFNYYWHPTSLTKIGTL